MTSPECRLHQQAAQVKCSPKETQNQLGKIRAELNHDSRTLRRYQNILTLPHSSQFFRITITTTCLETGNSFCPVPVSHHQLLCGSVSSISIHPSLPPHHHHPSISSHFYHPAALLFLLCVPSLLLILNVFPPVAKPRPLAVFFLLPSEG